MTIIRLTFVTVYLIMTFLITGCNVVEKISKKKEISMNEQLEYEINRERSSDLDKKTSRTLDKSEHEHKVKQKSLNMTRKKNKFINKELKTTQKAIEQTNLNNKKKLKAKGIYVSGWIAGSSKRMDQLIDLIDKTDLNAMVIDVKNDSGQVTYDSRVSLVNEIGSDRQKMIADLPKLLQKLKQKNIYLIGRVVVFKDPYLAAKKKNWAMHYKSGVLWRDSKGVAWVDPYMDQVWNYNLDIAKEAAKLGFDEIQFDYVRFPDNAQKVDAEVYFGNPNKWSKSEVIQNFLKTAKLQLKKSGVFISADVFGLTTSTSDDMSIGQQWGLVTQEVDFISPMIYPSHYSSGMYGFSNPDLNPYGIIKKAILDGNEKNKKLKQLNKSTAVIRPWVQDFTAIWLHPHKKYGYKEVKDQIRAAKEQGADEFLLWNPKCTYSYR